MSIIGDRIHQKRTECGMTLEELGEKLGVQRQAVSKWEKGEVQNIKRSYIAKMAEMFHCSPVWLMGFDDSEEVQLIYNAKGKEPITAIVDTREPIIGESNKRAQLYKVALDIKPENLDVAIQILKSLI